MTRPYRQLVEEGVLDRAAELFARQGYEHTSVQAIADAAGYSKTGVLHHFPNKEALRAGVLAQAEELASDVRRQVAELPAGQARDRRVIEALVDLALARPGLVSYMLSEESVPPDVTGIQGQAQELFGEDISTVDRGRSIRIKGALAALAMLSLLAHHAGESSRWRSEIVATSVDALGHHYHAQPAELEKKET